MKIQINQESKKVLTVSEMPIVRQIVQDFKDNKDDLSWDLEILKNIFGADEIINSTANISKNCRIYNYFNNESRNIDIWIDATLFCSYSSENNGGVFYIVGAYLTDIYQATGDNWKELQSRMYVRKFVESK